MEAGIVLPRMGVTDGRLDRLEAENIRLRTLLTYATSKADAEHQRSQRLGRLFESERSASRVAAEQMVAERMAAEETAAVYQRDLADGAARLASAEELNTQLLASEEFNRRILWTTTDFVTVLDLDGRLITVSENGPMVLGTTNFAGVIGQYWADFWACPDGRAAVLAALHAARLGRPSRFQAMLGTDGPGASLGASSGTATWWDIAVTPIDGADGRPERILAVSRDITELKQTEARQTLLMQELAHRMKNTLSLVQAVATQTLRNAASLEAAGEALSARLLALAQAHDVLLQGSFASASLRALVDGAAALHGDGVPGRFRVCGPDVTLGPRHGMTLALMLHELGTNATKYGALSTAAGHVAITWDVSGDVSGDGDGREDPGGASLRFRWEEIGGPAVTPPTRTGFGSRLIARSLAHSFGGIVSLSYPTTGAVLTFEAPLQTVAAEPGGLRGG